MEKRVEKLLRGGVDTTVVKVHAEVCLHCKERLYSQETIRHFEEIRGKLERNDCSQLSTHWSIISGGSVLLAVEVNCQLSAGTYEGTPPHRT